MTLRNTSTEKPLTPAIPEPSPNLGQRPTVAPDTRVESFLWSLYLEQKELAAEWQTKYQRMAESRRLQDQQFITYKAKRAARSASRRMQPSHNPTVSL
jgi:hypothetical protein